MTVGTVAYAAPELSAQSPSMRATHAAKTVAIAFAT
jgi:hypothetical protein